MSAQEYEWVNDAGIVALRGTPNPEITGGFAFWTQDPTTKEVTVTLSGLPDSVPLTFTPATGATADGTYQIVVNDDSGDPVFQVDAAGGVTSKIVAGSEQVFVDSSGNSGLQLSDAGAAIAVATNLGFFAATPTTQQAITGSLSTVIDAAAKAVLTSIIAALVAYGLATDGTT